MSAKTSVVILFIVGILGFLFSGRQIITPHYEAKTEDISFVGQEGVENIRGLYPGKKIWSDYLNRIVRIDQCGLASWYGPGFYYRPMSNGRLYDPRKYTVAHLNLPLGTKVYIINPDNGRSVIAEVADRGPYIPPRIVDLSEKIAEDLNMKEEGVRKVYISVLEKPTRF